MEKQPSNNFGQVKQDFLYLNNLIVAYVSEKLVEK